MHTYAIQSQLSSSAQPSAAHRSNLSSSPAYQIQRKADSCACGGGCPDCAAAGSQGQLAINEPGDVFEQEADRVAEQVMRMEDDDLPDADSTDAD